MGMVSIVQTAQKNIATLTDETPRRKQRGTYFAKQNLICGTNSRHS